MHKFDLVLVMSSALFLAAGCGAEKAASPTGGASGSATGGSGGRANGGGSTGSGGSVSTGGSAGTGGASGSVDANGSNDGGSTPTAQVSRGTYLVGMLGCGGCHTPKVTGGTMADPTMLLAGSDCFVSTPGCLSSSNLTPDNDSGIGAMSDQAVIDAIRLGKDPGSNSAGKYLSARMPYYQYGTLSDDDARAIVAYLRSLPPIKHQVKPSTAPFDQAATAAEWLPVDASKLPAAAAGAPASVSTGKYLASMMCVTCHSPSSTATPKHVDEATAFRGGQAATITSNGTMMMFQSANLTPDTTGLKGWTAAEIVTAIKTSKDRMGKTLCSPMRGNAVITDADANAIAEYLRAIPPVANMVAACGARN